jgi:wyosine [tRNA(Phe)-imidazoG37] synthetase (radical SAM superfamily)
METEIVYGPVSSWRLGRSLGVDIICGKNICTFNCIYCQLGESEEKTIERRVFVETDKIIGAVEKALREVKEQTDVITLSGTGEPTLAKNLAEIITSLAELSELPVAVLTNCSLLYREHVRHEIARADIVVGSLDAGNEQTWRKVNRPSAELEFGDLIEGMKKFNQNYSGYFALEVMFTAVNKDEAEEIARYAAEIKPDEVQINTPRRQCEATCLSPEQIQEVAVPFREAGLNVRCVYQADIPKPKTLLGKEKLRHIKRPRG